MDSSRDTEKRLLGEYQNAKKQQHEEAAAARGSNGRYISGEPGFFRSITESGFRFFSETAWYTSTPSIDEAWTRGLIQRYEEVSAKGTVGDTPEVVNPGFVGNGNPFWSMAFLAIICGVVTGFAGLLVLNCAEKIPELWTDNGKFDEAEDFDIYSGEKWWIMIPTLTGLLIGILTVVLDVPDERDGFFKEVSSCHVNLKYALPTYFISILSLSCGATLGPEQSLGTVGGGLAIYLVNNYGEALNIVNEDDIKLTKMIGFTSALGGLFPTPILGNVLVAELVRPPKYYMEYMTLFTIGSLANWFIVYSIRDQTYMDSISSNYYSTLDWNFTISHVGKAILIGAISGVLGLFLMIFIGVCKQVFIRLKDRIDGITGKQWVSRLILPVIGGIIIGCMAWVIPATIGDGNLVIKSLIEFGIQKQISKHTLVSSIFGKIFCLGVSMNCGMVGGFIFPIITVAAMIGVLAFQLVTDDDCSVGHVDPVTGESNLCSEPFALYICCFIAAVPCSVVPLPLTFIFLVGVLFFLGLNQMTCVTASVFVSYFIVCGTGIIENIMKKQKERAEKRKSVTNSTTKGMSTAESDAKSRAMYISNNDIKTDMYQANSVDSTGFQKLSIPNTRGLDSEDIIETYETKF